MSHTHDDKALHFGCDVCIEQARRDEFASLVPIYSDERLCEILHAREHVPNDWQAEMVEAELQRRYARLGEVLGAVS